MEEDRKTGSGAGGVASVGGRDGRGLVVGAVVVVVGVAGMVVVAVVLAGPTK